MGRKFNWKRLTFEQVPDITFSSSFPIPDGLPLPANDPRIALLFTHGGVSRDVALSVPAVARGVSSLTTLANLPLVTYKGNNEQVKNVLLSQIDPAVPNVVTLSRTIEDLIFEAVAYWEILAVNKSTLYPTKARHIPLGDITENNGEYWIRGVKVSDPDTILKFPSPRQALLPAISQTVRRAVALARTSEMYARNPMPKLLFSPKADVDPQREETLAAIQDFADNASDSPYSYVGAAVDAKPLDLLSPAEIQLIEQDKSCMLAIANFFDMDPEEVGVSTTSRTYKNAVERRIDRRNDQLGWVALSIEQRLSLGDVTPGGYFVRFNFDEFFRADPLTRAQVAQIEFQMGAVTVDEYRAGKGLPPLTPEQQLDIMAHQPAATKVQASFASDEDEGFAFESAEFSDVNQERRTVKVLAVPYGEIARKNDRKYVFTKGSLTWPEPMKKVKLLRDHDYTQSVGYATAIEDTDKGLLVTFKVVPGPDGDRALAGFTDGNFDAASIGVDFNDNGVYTDDSQPGIYFVRSARLKEISQVSIPAFENAGLISVKATSDNEGVNMTDAPERTYTLAEFQALQGMFGVKTNEQEKHPETKPVVAAVQEDPNVAPRELKANAQTETVKVIEPGPYRFDGNEGKFDLSTDLITFQRSGDLSARKRVLDFMSEDFAVTVANVATANPTIQRPDMFVDNLDFSSPVVDTIYKGSPPNGVNPFAFPKYSASATLVADHVEGTEPTLGSYSVTNQTVTPTALSGKIEINREAWDQGGNPAVSGLIRNEMRRAYKEGLETAAGTFLDAATPGGTTTITTAAVDAALEGEIIDALVSLQALRGGYRFSDFLLHIDLFKAMVKAKETNGRRLYPALNPTNATGTVSRNFGSIDVNGLRGRMAWSLGVTGTVAENSYLLNPEDVHCWATAPQDMTFDIQVKSVYLGIWGYKAFAVSRAEGLRRFIYDPV